VKGAEVEHRLVVLPPPPAGHGVIGEALGLSGREPPVRDCASEDPCDVRVEHANVAPEGKGEHRTRGVGTDAGEFEQGVEAVRNLATMALDDL
jgi:hypothetical protein